MKPLDPRRTAQPVAALTTESERSIAPPPDQLVEKFNTAMAAAGERNRVSFPTITTETQQRQTPALDDVKKLMQQSMLNNWIQYGAKPDIEE